ncbi:MAG: NADH-quinone oxidoreductase subunit M, partial [Pararhodobacter sp.]
TGVVFAAAYGLWLYRKVAFGPLVKDSLKTIADLDRREKLLFAPLVVMTLLLGVYPALITDLIGPSTEALVAHYNDANGIVPAEPMAQAAAVSPVSAPAAANSH